jgi:hypothetical protein
VLQNFSREKKKMDDDFVIIAAASILMVAVRLKRRKKFSIEIQTHLEQFGQSFSTNDRRRCQRFEFKIHHASIWKNQCEEIKKIDRIFIFMITFEINLLILCVF